MVAAAALLPIGRGKVFSRRFSSRSDFSRFATFLCAPIATRLGGAQSTSDDITYTFDEIERERDTYRPANRFDHVSFFFFFFFRFRGMRVEIDPEGIFAVLPRDFHLRNASNHVARLLIFLSL